MIIIKAILLQKVLFLKEIQIIMGYFSFCNNNIDQNSFLYTSLDFYI